MNELVAHISGLVMSVAFMTGYIPQIVKAHKTKSTKDISFWLIALCCLGYVSGLLYIYCTGFQLWLLVNYAGGLCFSSTLMVYWWKYRNGFKSSIRISPPRTIS